MAKKGGAKITYEFEDRDGVLAKLEQLGNDINQDDVMLEALTEGADVVRPEVEAQAPYRTGQLRGNIEAEPDPQNMPSVRIGPTGAGFYGRFLEYGTSKMAAQPFVRPALDGARVRAEAAIGDALWRAINSRV